MSKSKFIGRHASIEKSILRNFTRKVSIGTDDSDDLDESLITLHDFGILILVSLNAIEVSLLSRSHLVIIVLDVNIINHLLLDASGLLGRGASLGDTAVLDLVDSSLLLRGRAILSTSQFLVVVILAIGDLALGLGLSAWLLGSSSFATTSS